MGKKIHIEIVLCQQGREALGLKDQMPETKAPKKQPVGFIHHKKKHK